MVLNGENSAVFEICYRNRAIKVTLEFQEEPDEAAERALADRLRELYFRKINLDASFELKKPACPGAGCTEDSYV